MCTCTQDGDDCFSMLIFNLKNLKKYLVWSKFGAGGKMICCDAILSSNELLLEYKQNKLSQKKRPAYDVHEADINYTDK